MREEDKALERGIDVAYQRLCNANSKGAKTRALNQMLDLAAQRSWQRVEEMEAARMARIRDGG